MGAPTLLAGPRGGHAGFVPAPAARPTRPLDREIARLAGPALVTLLAEPAYLLADTAVVGHPARPS